MLSHRSLKGKTVFITGGSRGIGRSIALRLAQDGANIIIAAKTDVAHSTLEGTIYSVAKEVEALGARCLPVKVDVRSPEDVQKAIDMGVKEFGGIDILINNASAIQLTGTLDTDVKRYDLMNQINARGTWLCSKLCLPHLLKSTNPHILNISPPLLMDAKWFRNHTAYTMAKYGMSICVLGMSEEFRGQVAVNALWPLTTIATAAVNMLGGDMMMKTSRKPEIMADAAWSILTREVSECSGNFFIDEDVLREEGVTDFDQYAHEPGHPLTPDFFIPDEKLKMLKNTNSDTSFLKNKSSTSQGENVTQYLTTIQERISENNDIKKMALCIQYDLKTKPSDNAQVYTLDLKYGNGSVYKGKGVGKPDCIIGMSVHDFGLLVQGKLNSREAFSSGRITVRGNLDAAMRVHSLLKQSTL